MYSVNIIYRPLKVSLAKNIPDLETATRTLFSQFQAMDPKRRAEKEFVFFVREQESRRIVASLTEDRIIGKFIKREWVGENLYPCWQEVFDATDFILRMHLPDIHKAHDYKPIAAAIGRAHIKMDGLDDLYEVLIEDQIATFFGIDSIADLTQENLDFARARAGIRQAKAA